MNSRHFCWVNSMKDRKKPAIRFKGFTEDWEQRKLGDIADRVVRKNINNESTLPLTISAQYGLIDQVTYFNNRVASRDVSNYYLVLNGEFAYNKSTSDGFPYGAVKRLDLYRKGVLSTLYIVFSIKNKKKTNSDFLTFFFDTDRWHKGVYERAAEGARNHGLLNISADDFFDIDLSLPKSEQEQAVIGAYFKQLDNLITLHQRKYDKLVNVKKSMLEKMFPKNGESIPDIRFSGFTEDWEQRKLGEVLRTLPFKPFLKIPDQDGKYEIIQQGNEPIIGYANGEPCEDFRNTVIFGDHTLSLYKPKQPFFVATDGVRILQGTNDMDGYYLLSLLEGNSPKSEGYKRYYSILVDREVLFTKNYYEQVKIGLYFKQLDNLITLHQRKLEKLKNIKKSCLEKMFI